eukprot:scaffold11746_cov109-Isochrysis_galbana.AAC.2
MGDPALYPDIRHARHVYALRCEQRVEVEVEKASRLVAELLSNLCSGAGGVDLRVREIRIITNAAAMHNSRWRREAKLVLFKEMVGAHAEAARMLDVVVEPSEAHVVMVLVKVQLEEERVEVGQIVADPRDRITQNRHGLSAAATCGRKGIERHGSPSSERGHPSLCTSVSVIGLSLAMTKERMEVKNRGCDNTGHRDNPGTPTDHSGFDLHMLKYMSLTPECRTKAPHTPRGHTPSQHTQYAASSSSWKCSRGCVGSIAHAHCDGRCRVCSLCSCRSRIKGPCKVLEGRATRVDNHALNLAASRLGGGRVDPGILLSIGSKLEGVEAQGLDGREGREGRRVAGEVAVDGGGAGFVVAVQAHCLDEGANDAPHLLRPKLGRAQLEHHPVLLLPCQTAADSSAAARIASQVAAKDRTARYRQPEVVRIALAPPIGGESGVAACPPLAASREPPEEFLKPAVHLELCSSLWQWQRVEPAATPREAVQHGARSLGVGVRGQLDLVGQRGEEQATVRSVARRHFPVGHVPVVRPENGIGDGIPIRLPAHGAAQPVERATGRHGHRVRNQPHAGRQRRTQCATINTIPGCTDGKNEAVGQCVGTTLRLHRRSDADTGSQSPHTTCRI